MPRATTAALIATALALAGCASRPKRVAVAPPPPVAGSAAPMPPGARPGMTIPTRLSDGGYLTPNRDLSADAATWHVRAALNVAALACRGPAQAGIVARYNAMLTAQKASLAMAQQALSNEYRAGGGDWQDRYDDAMTRLYNYFSQSFVRDDFCRAADAVLAEAAAISPAAFAGFAARSLPLLDRPFVDFYRAYDRWRAGAMTQPVIALAAPARAARAPTGRPPWLAVDVAALQDRAIADPGPRPHAPPRPRRD